MLKTLVFISGLVPLVFGQTSAPIYVALGDSLGEGVQSADASYRTQPFSYPNRIAAQMGVNFPLPLIKGGAFTFIESVKGRTRIDPTIAAFNLSVSGADSTSILNAIAGTPIDDETDLVLSPRNGSQVQIAQSLRAPLLSCWIGSNDALGTVLSFDHMDASQLTPVPVFAANFHQIATSLTSWNNKVVFGNVPNVLDVGFLVDNQDLVRFLGKDFGLPAGSYTTVVAMLLFKMGINNGSLLQNPSWVLDPNEVQTIQTTIQQYNEVIAREAATVSMPVVGIHGILDFVRQHPLAIGPVTLTTHYLGGIYSLDGVHPSNIGHAVIANEFIKTINSAFHLNVPLISSQQLLTILAQDPFVDFNGDLKVRGRPLAGLLETMGPRWGISGDFSDAMVRPGIDPSMGPKFMQAYFAATGRDPNTAWTQTDAIEALRRIFSVEKWAGRR